MLKTEKLTWSKRGIAHRRERAKKGLHRSRYYGRVEVKCPNTRMDVLSPKQIRRAATEFIGLKKAWSVFVGYSPLPSASLQAEFNALRDKWRNDTFFQSSVSEICLHSAYQTIMAMGKEALPLILKDLEDGLDHWFYALKSIVRKDVAEGAISLEAARQQWLTWGREHHYLQ